MRPEKLHMFSAVHLHYEIDMCEKVVRLLPEAAPEHTLNNALVESYALHLRNLIEFLYWKPRPPDDVNAIHYVKSETAWLKARGSAPAVLLNAKTRADKQVAHLTKKRYADGAPEKTWTPGHEVKALLTALRLFLEHADPTKLHPAVHSAIDRLASIFIPPATPTKKEELYGKSL